MANQTKRRQTLKNGRTSVLNSVKTIQNQLVDLSEVAIEETVATGVKYQKLAVKAIKKSEPLMEKQVDIIFDTAEEIYAQLGKSNKRFQRLFGITKQVNQAKRMLTKTYKQSSEVLDKNVAYAAKTLKYVTDRVEDNIQQASKVVQSTVDNADTQTAKSIKEIKKTVSKKSPARARKTVKKTIAKVKRTAAAKKVKAVSKRVAKTTPAKQVKKTAVKAKSSARKVTATRRTRTKASASK